MKNHTIFSLSFVLIAFISFSQTVNWIHRPDTNQGTETIHMIEVDNQGNTYVLGHVGDTIDIDPSSNTVMLEPADYSSSGFGIEKITFIQKIDPSGNVVWTKAWECIYDGGATDEKALKIMNNQYIFVAGWYQGDLRVDLGPNADTLPYISPGTNSYIFKLDLNGNFISKENSDINSNIKITDLEIDANSNIVIGGSFVNTANLTIGSGSPTNLTSAGFKDCFVAKYNASLQLIWARSFGGNLQEDVDNIAIDNSSNIITGGYFSSATNDFDPGMGSFSLSHTNSNDAFIHKMDGAGNFIWARAAASSSTISVDRIAVGPNNDLYAIGLWAIDLAIDYPTNTNYVNGVSTDSYIWKLDSNGVTEWSNFLTSINSNEVHFVRTNGNELLVGGRAPASLTDSLSLGTQTTPYFLDTLTRGYVAHFDFNGNLNSVDELKNGYSVVKDVAFYNNNMLIAGHWNGTTDFNPGPTGDSLQAIFMNDFFVTSLSPLNASVYNFEEETKTFIYPNPTSTHQRINYSSDYSFVEIFDNSGRQIYSGNEMIPFEKSGMYYLRFHTKEGIDLKKLIVK